MASHVFSISDLATLIQKSQLAKSIDRPALKINIIFRDSVTRLKLPSWTDKKTLDNDLKPRTGKKDFNYSVFDILQDLDIVIGIDKRFLSRKEKATYNRAVTILNSRAFPKNCGRSFKYLYAHFYAHAGGFVSAVETLAQNAPKGSPISMDK